MKKVIYHGSKKVIGTPALGYGKKYNDYGLGFYCTEEIELAKAIRTITGATAYHTAIRTETKTDQ